MTSAARFFCKGCNVERSFATELSKYSRRGLAHGNRDEVMMVCIYCAPNDHIPAVIKERETHVEIRKVAPSPVTEDHAYTYKEAAAILGIKPSSVRNYTSAGLLPNFKVGQNGYIRKSDLDAFITKRDAGDLDWSQYRTTQNEKGKKKVERNVANSIGPKKRKEVGHVIYEKRLENKLSQRDLGILANVPQTHISKIERSLKIPRDQVVRVLEALDVPKKRIEELTVTAAQPTVFRRKKAEPKVEPQSTEVISKTVVLPPAPEPVKAETNGHKPDATKTLLEASKALMAAGNTDGAQTLIDMVMEQMDVGA